MLEVQQLHKKYKEKIVLENVSFDLKSGEIVGLVGENGAGKSTLLQLLATVMQPTEGEIRLNGLSYQNNTKEIRQEIGYVPQDISIWEEFTVEENMLFFEKLSWKKSNERAMPPNLLGHAIDPLERRCPFLIWRDEKEVESGYQFAS